MVKLANGKKFDCPFLGVASVGIAYIDIQGSSLLEALSVFGDSDATKIIVYHEGAPDERTLTGYTQLIGVEYADTDMQIIRVSLRRPYVTGKE